MVELVVHAVKKVRIGSIRDLKGSLGYCVTLHIFTDKGKEKITMFADNKEELKITRK